MARVTLIWSQSNNGAIGKDGKLIFKCTEDLTRFKELTLGKVVVMGRKTWDSLPESVKPLPGRYNVILTKDRTFQETHPQMEVIHDLRLFLERNKGKEIVVIGGGQLYEQAMEFATTLDYTLFYKYADGDTFAPQIDMTKFKLKFKSETKHSKELGIDYCFIRLVRKLHPTITSHHVVLVRRKQPPTTP